MGSRVAKHDSNGNWSYRYIILDIRVTNHQVLMIVPRPTPLWGYRVLPTEVFCDSILVIFNGGWQRVPPVSGNHYKR